MCATQVIAAIHDASREEWRFSLEDSVQVQPARAKVVRAAQGVHGPSPLFPVRLLIPLVALPRTQTPR